MRSKFIALTWLGFFCALLLDTRVQADSDVKHGKVVEIMDLAKSVGVNSIIIAARWNSGGLL